MEQRFSVYRSPPRLKLPRLEGDGVLHEFMGNQGCERFYTRNLWYLNLMDNSLIYSFSRIFGYKGKQKPCYLFQGFPTYTI